MISGQEKDPSSRQAIAEGIVVPNLHPETERYKNDVRDLISASLMTDGGVLDTVLTTRISELGDQKTQLKVLLEPNPKARLARYEILAGVKPVDGEGARSVDELITMTLNPDLPPINLPPEYDERIMDLAKKLGMLGGGPMIFSREDIGGEVARSFKPDHILIHGAANKAPYERLVTALELTQIQHYDFAKPILFSTSMRKLKDPELAIANGFYFDTSEEAKILETEFDLCQAALLKQGFTTDRSSNQVNDVKVHENGVLSVDYVNEEGQRVRLFVPSKDMSGAAMSGLHGAMAALRSTPSLGCDLEGSKFAHITSTHYGPAALENSAEAQVAMGITLGQERVFGDNQPTRTARAHLMEICMLAKHL